MEGSAEGQPSGSREDRLTQIKPPAPLDFQAINLADCSGRDRARQEVELCIALAMCDREKSTKVKLFLY